MKSSFSRSFFMIALVLLLALTSLGASFQILVKRYLTDNAYQRLEKDAQIVSKLAYSYSAGGTLSIRDFLLNLDIAAQVSGCDAVICDSRGKVILCSDALYGCNHQGLFVNRDYMNKVMIKCFVKDPKKRPSIFLLNKIKLDYDEYDNY